jgi:hypothetical protein
MAEAEITSQMICYLQFINISIKALQCYNLGWENIIMNLRRVTEYLTDNYQFCRLAYFPPLFVIEVWLLWRLKQ